MTRPPGGKGPLFDSYVMVDWSAAGAPKRGRDSIWIAHLARNAKGGRRRLKRLENPATRQEATEMLSDIFAEELAASRRVLAGFDFAFGYPAGAARKLSGAKDWSALWRKLDETIEDGPANKTNRFAAAAALNAAWPGAGPFWGNGLKTDIKGLGRKKPKAFGGKLPPERRLTELRCMAAEGAQPKSVWQLSGAGAVGGQTLTGLKALQRLRTEKALEGHIEVWPFDTGLAPPQSTICFAEIYPSLFEINPRKDEPKDAAQMRAAAERFAALDQASALRGLFAGPEDLTAEERRRIVAEEGWILGAGFEQALAKPQNSVKDMLRELAPPRPAAQPEPTAPEPAPKAPSRPTLRLVQNTHPELRYERDPQAIYAESFATVRRETRLEHLPEDVAEIAVRLVHACGMPEIADRLSFSADLADRAVMALENGAPVICDCEMVASGVIKKMLPRENSVYCTLRDPRTPGLAAKIGNTRSAAAVELWRERIKGSVVAIGNAPTALFHLLELLDGGWPRPAAILGFPVGFVGAAESKALLAGNSRGAAYLTLRGRRGGSAMASAAVNALSALAMTRDRPRKKADKESG